jgi:hypothetical protein
MKPTPANPRIIMAHVEGSGTALIPDGGGGMLADAPGVEAVTNVRLWSAPPRRPVIAPVSVPVPLVATPPVTSRKTSAVYARQKLCY